MSERLVVLLDDKDWQELHNLMGLAIVSEDGSILHKMFEGGYNQEWYRRIVRCGMRSLRLEFEKKRKEFENEG